MTASGVTAEFIVVIPARLAASRLPGKPLADIHGRPMVVRVAERARASGAARVVIATDHRDIADAARTSGFDAVMPQGDFASGTDRIAAAVGELGLGPDQIVVNVQGDEPLVEPRAIREVAQLLAARPEAHMATLCHRISDEADARSPHVVKVVFDRSGLALYFSRSPIPHARDAAMRGELLPPGLPMFRHVGIYAYRVDFLVRYARLAPAPIEQFEALEQLRALWHGYRIAVAESDAVQHAGVDTPEDLDRVRRAFDQGRESR